MSEPGSLTAEPTGLFTSDNVDIAVYDFGGEGPDLLLVHATGFCAGVFRPLARELRDRFHCHGIDLRGHGHSSRPADGKFPWSRFADDVLEVISQLGLRQPFGFGHSCGATSVLMAEERRSGTFGGLYCFEPVIFPDSLPPAFTTDNPLARGARRRRDVFPSAEEALANFLSKPPFANLDPMAMANYVTEGFEKVPTAEGGDGKAVRLRCRRDDEAAVYEEGGRHDAFANLSTVSCPVTLAYGGLTDAFGRDFMEADAAALPDAEIVVLDHLGHFGPVEDPSMVARSVKAALRPG